MRRILKVIIISSLLSFNAQSEVCEIEITRKACPGFEAESFKKCQGEKTCVRKYDYIHPRECEKKAYQSCLNSRLSVTHSKVIRAKYNGQVMRDSENFCEPDRYDFNSCEVK